MLFFLPYLCYNSGITIDVFVGKIWHVIIAVTLLGLLTGFVPALVGNNPSPQGLGSGPHGSVQWGDQVDEGWHHPAPCRGSLCVRPVPWRSRLGPPRLQAHRIQAQSSLRDDACGQDVRREQWWDFPSIDWRVEGSKWSPDLFYHLCWPRKRMGAILKVKTQKCSISAVCRAAFILEVVIIFEQADRTRSPNGGLREMN